MRVAIQCFKPAIKIDPEYALAWAGLADCHTIFRVYSWVSTENCRPQALAAMTQAVKLAPALWEVNYSCGLYAFNFERDWRQAGPHFERAVAINPRSSLAQAYYSIFLATEGRAEEAASHMALACQLDPLSPFMHAIAGGALFAVKRFDAAERAARHSLELQTDYPLGLWVHGIALCGLGRSEDAIEPLERAVTLSRAAGIRGELGTRIRARRTYRRREPSAARDGGAEQPRRICPGIRIAVHLRRPRRSGDAPHTLEGVG
jgi:tetratricopeptide (TPR) repeat protein